MPRIVPVFTISQRDALREHVLRLADEDERIVAGAAVGSLAVDGGDRFSDLDLTFAVVDDAPVADVLDDWTERLAGELDAIHLTDLVRDPTTYRVFLLPDALQFDLSLTPAARFRAAGPRFRLLFGETAGDAELPPPPTAVDLFGWGVICALHSRSCIERARLWQAEHYIGAVRDHALSLACFSTPCRRCRHVATTTFRPRFSRGSRARTSSPSSPPRCDERSPCPYASSCAVARTPISRTRPPWRRASPSSPDAD